LSPVGGVANAAPEALEIMTVYACPGTVLNTKGPGNDPEEFPTLAVAVS